MTMVASTSKQSARISARTAIGLCLLSALLTAGAGHAQELLFHYKLDGSIGNSGSVGTEGRLYVAKEASAPQTVDGEIGDAFYFTSPSVIATPFSLDSNVYPQVTITAWVKLDADSPGGYIVSSGNGNGPRLSVYGNRIMFDIGRTSVVFNKPMERDEWVFVAAAGDVTAPDARLYQGDDEMMTRDIDTRTLAPPTAFFNPEDPDAERIPYLFVGAHQFWQWPAMKMALDDVRVYSGALTPEQIDAVRNSIQPGADTTAVSGAGTSAGTTQTGSDTPFETSMPTGLPVDQTASAETADTSSTGSTDGTSASAIPGTQGDSPLTDDNLAQLQTKSEETAPVDIAYDSEEAAQAAADARTQAAADAAASSTSGQVGPVGEEQFSALSGTASGNTAILALEDQFINGIAWGELSNKPCAFEVKGLSGGFASWKECSGTFLGAVGTIFNDGKSATLPEADTAIGRLQVCQSSFSDRIKGLIIYGDRINPDGTTTYRPAMAKEEGANCGTWKQDVLCPTGTLATGIVVHFKEGGEGGIAGTSSVATGLQLVCRRLGITGS
jgi:hypothetical protein